MRNRNEGDCAMKLIDMHSHWGTVRGLGTDAQSVEERAGQAQAWHRAPVTVTEAEMADDFRRHGVRAILDLGVRRQATPEALRACVLRLWHERIEPFEAALNFSTICASDSMVAGMTY